MATRTVRIIEELNTDQTESWLERLEETIAATEADDVSDRKKVAILLSSIGNTGYNLLKAWCGTEKPNTKRYDELKKLLMDHLCPKPPKTSERFKFYQIKQQTGETLSLYLARIREAATHCDFGDAYDEMISDKFVGGLSNAKTRNSLLNEDKLTTAQAFEKATAKEAAETSSTVLGQNAVNKVSHTRFSSNKPQSRPGSGKVTKKQYQKGKNTVICEKCTFKGHSAEQCRTKCLYCKKEGHIVANCRKKDKKVRNVDADEGCVSDSREEYYTGAAMNHVDFVELSESSQFRDPEGISKSVLSSELPASSIVLDCTVPDSAAKLPASLQGVPDSAAKLPASLQGACESSTTTQVVHPQRCGKLVGPDNRGCGELTNDSIPSVNHVHEQSSKLPTENSHKIVTKIDDFLVNTSENSLINPVSREADLSGETQNFDMSELEINSVVKGSEKPMLNVLINDTLVPMELDTGAAVSCISQSHLHSLKLNCKLEPSTRNLSVANGESVQALSIAKVNVKFRDSMQVLTLYVIDGKFPTLFGREWIRAFFGNSWLSKLVGDTVHQLKVRAAERAEFIESVKQSKVFEPGVGIVKGYEATLDLKVGSKPKFCKARPVPFSLKEKVSDALEKGEAEGILERVDFSEFASPAVPVLKDDGTVRVCGDYKTTLNPCIDTKVYPLPTVEDCFSEMKGGDLFTKIDIKQAYNNIPLRASDRTLTTINTHKGLYQWTRLPYGVSSSSAIFQSIMDRLLSGIKGVVCRVDDILITAPTDQLHMSRVREVLKRLEEAGFRCKWEKSEFMQESVIYIGHQVNREGIHPCQNKVETLVNAPYPKNQAELISFLGAVNYYSRYLPKLATVIEPLNALRGQKTAWRFGVKEKESFDKLKALLTLDQVLAFYDPNLPLRIDTDASSVGLGVVMSHVYPDGSERPVEFHSRTLTEAERKYSQIEKEALSIIWGVQKLHRYVYARPFSLVTDHKPLLFLFHEHKRIPEMAISRIQRWAIILASYQYSIEYRSTEKHYNADVCSRFPLKQSTNDLIEGEINSIESPSVFALWDDKPLLNSTLIARYTRGDPVLSKVMMFVQEGWPPDWKAVDQSEQKKETPEVLAHFHQRRFELSVEQNCLLWGARVVIPEKLRSSILDLLHCTHLGSCSMKALGRGYVWWPRMDEEVEKVARSCQTCQVNQPHPAKAVPHPWTAPSAPWERIHLDFCSFSGFQWLLVVDAFSKWVEVVNMRSDITAGNLIKKLREIFSRMGLPLVCVSDNGPQLVSQEFESFLTRNGIKHLTIAYYKSQSNGAAEALVKTFKAAMTKMMETNKDLDHCLNSWLLLYRNTPHSSNGVSPTVSLFGRKTRTMLSLLNPLSCKSKLQRDHLKKEQEVLDSKERTFEKGDKVWYRDEGKQIWEPGTVLSKNGSIMYDIESESMGVQKKHLDQMTARYEAAPKVSSETPSFTEGSSTVEGTGVEGSGMISRKLTPNLPDPDKLDIRPKSDRLSEILPSSRPQECDIECPPRPVTVRSSTRKVKPIERTNYHKLGGP